MGEPDLTSPRTTCQQGSTRLPHSTPRPRQFQSLLSPSTLRVTPRESICPTARLSQEALSGSPSSLEPVRRLGRGLQWSTQTVATPPRAHPALCPASAHVWVLRTQPATPGSRTALTRVEQPAWAAAGVPLRQVWDPGGRARLPCLLCSATKCEPAGQQRPQRRVRPPPTSRPRAPPGPSRPALGHDPSHPPADAAPSPSRLQSSSACHSETLRRWVSAATHHQGVTASRCPCLSDALVLPGTLYRSRQRTPSSRDCTAGVLQRHGASARAVPSSTPDAWALLGRFAKFASNL